MAVLNETLNKFLLAGLFFISIFLFAITMGERYDKTAEYMTTDQIDLSGIERSLNDTNERAKEWNEAFSGSSPLWQIGVIAVESLFTIGKSIRDAIFSVFNGYFSIIKAVFGIPAIVTGVLTTMLVVAMIVAVYKFMKEGN